MPDAAPPVNRSRQSLSRSHNQSAVLTSSEVVFDTSTVVPLQSSSCLTPNPVKAEPFPSALTTMASQPQPPEGGLKPAPVGRLRGADPHRLSSCARSALASFACSWRTDVANSEVTEVRAPKMQVLRLRPLRRTPLSDCLFCQGGAAGVMAGDRCHAGQWGGFGLSLAGEFCFRVHWI
jgi:hypothetical protein